MSSDVEQNPFEQEADSEDEMDWEEVDVHHDHAELEEQHLEITLSAAPSSSKPKKSTTDEFKRKGITHEERLMRINCHKMHTIVLLANAKVRNTWINDETLQARLMSLTPINLQNEFANIHPSRIPDQGQRGRMFEKALQHLASWWTGTFFEVLPSGHIRSHTFDEIQSKLETFGLLHDEDELDDETLEDILGYEVERIKGPKSLMKHALNRSGSRDVSAQLFTSLCRALGIPARLVVSLQSVPWQPSIGKPKPTYSKSKATKGKEKGKGKERQVDREDDMEKASSFGVGGRRLDGAPVPQSEKAKGKQKAEPIIKLRKQKDKGHRSGSSEPSTSKPASPDPRTTPPVFWTEVFSRPDSKWMPVDPVRGIVNKRKAFDPTPTPTHTGTAAAAPSSSMLPPRPQAKPNNYSLPKGVKEENRMQYVLAFEEDGYARDVTRRYAKQYNAKIAKSQGGSSAAKSGGKGRQMWWESVLGLVKRPYQLHRDDLEDDELAANQMSEGMPTTISGFKDHPLYALARHLKQTEVIHPPPPETSEIGKFRGEPVYPRSSVVPLKSAETWMRTEGRIIKAGCQPLKTIKARPGTVNRMRELEVMKDELRDAGHSAESVEVMQGLYARSQTELYIPQPVVDGKIPKNDFGNIDLYVPTMLPKGAVHVPYKGTAKIARKLGFDHAEAVTGFEFRKRRANAVIEGIVIAAKHEHVLLEAYWEAQKADEEKARAKKEEKALQHWIKLIQGLRIRDRLLHEYADRGTSSKEPGSSKAAVKRTKRTRKASSNAGDDDEVADRSGDGGGFLDDEDKDKEEDAASHHGEDQGGGFLVGADDVVQAFHLPKYNPLILKSSHNLFTLGGGHNKKHAAGDDEAEDIEDDGGAESRPPIEYTTYDLEEDADASMSEVAMDVDDEYLINGGLVAMANQGDDEAGAPKTMQELLDAADNAKTNVIEPVAEDVQTNGGSVAGADPAGDVTTRLRIRPSRNASHGRKQPPPARNSRPSVNRKKRKRGGDEDDETDEAEESPWDEDDAEPEQVDFEDGEDEEDEDDGAFGSSKSTRKTPRKRPRSSAAKTPSGPPRARKAAKPKATAAHAPPTDRVLRSRGSKSAS